MKSIKARVAALEKEIRELKDLKRLVLSKGRVGGKVEFIITWFEEMLAEEGEITVQEARDWADSNGVSWTLMNKAKHRLGLSSVRLGRHFSWKR